MSATKTAPKDRKNKERRQRKRQRQAEMRRAERNKYLTHQGKPVKTPPVRIIKLLFDSQYMEVTETGFMGKAWAGEKQVFTLEELEEMGFELVEWDGRQVLLPREWTGP